ncbi:MAG: class I SAM-dependent methyltransferase [Oscillospiraceae bacterium]|jgi:23S rRNA (cytosine1962-C5)-methyltransferase|nr:class I SAM-dependent methyltransferase [Oscillospiraceae bacterium]
MRAAQDWDDYALLDCSDGERLERWGEYILIRPDPQVIWRGQRRHPGWKQAHARYQRAASGGGQWEYLRELPEQWGIRWRELSFFIKPMGFKHTGLFPEQAANWALLTERIRAAGRPIKVLNLFAYTGGATLACLAAGASVAHVDAARGMVLRAKENALRSGLAGGNVRWLVEDCVKFAQREIRRGSRYDVILLDPPSYGRGPGGEVWKLEDELHALVDLCGQLLSPQPLLLLLNSYSAELSPGVMQYLLASALVPQYGGTATCDEIGLPVEATGLVLPCGSTAMLEF